MWEKNKLIWENNILIWEIRRSDDSHVRSDKIRWDHMRFFRKGRNNCVYSLTVFISPSTVKFHIKTRLIVSHSLQIIFYLLLLSFQHSFSKQYFIFMSHSVNDENVGWIWKDEFKLNSLQTFVFFFYIFYKFNCDHTSVRIFF